MARPPRTTRPASARPPAPRAASLRKPRNAYHHGNLRQALLAQAVATVRDRGVDALTLRDVGARLGVSRTALYRHFADKTALLEAVASDGFIALRQSLTDAWEGAGRGRAGFEAQGLAYVRFARTNPGHYRVMFSGHVDKTLCDPALTRESANAFGVLLTGLSDLQQRGLVPSGPIEPLALFVWSAVHGVSMLAIDGQLTRPGVAVDHVAQAVVDRIWLAVTAPADAPAPLPLPRHS